MTTARTLVVADTNFAVGYPRRDPRALQASECHELLNPTKTSDKKSIKSQFTTVHERLSSNEGVTRTS